tara:strand:- start:1813 stop:2694 length:882 start_codon:yes stop_codon:yes gene_type:complete
MADLDGMDVTFLDPKIIVFHNAIEDCDGLIDYYETNAKWEGWYGFGRQIEVSGPHMHEEPEFPSEELWEAQVVDAGMSPEDEYRKLIARAFYKTSKIYINQTGTTLPNWTSMAWGLARYIPDEDIIGNKDLTMNYHPDYEPLRHEQAGEKYAITSVFYPNDDYEGGEISFKIVKEDGSFTMLDYKPVKGDYIVFPSGHPYYHGVKRIWKSPKYMVRTYWLYEDEGSSDWHEMRKKYGADFPEMERARIKSNYMIMEPYMHSMFTIREYYDRLEAGTLPPKNQDARPGEDAYAV